MRPLKLFLFLFSLFFAYRKGLHIFECLLFETDDLIMRKNEKHVILCLLEVARRGAKFGKCTFFDLICKQYFQQKKKKYTI